MELNTEQKILEAAQEIFHQKGYDGARMQEIAGHAGINKGLLHYYFKTKDKLFAAIFDAAFHKMITEIVSILRLDACVAERLCLIVDRYMALLMQHPDLPRFVVHELNNNPAGFGKKHITREAKAAFVHFSASVHAEIKQKKIPDLDPRQLFINTLSLIVFPFIARPLIQGITAASNTELKQLLADRKEQVKDSIRRELKV